MAVRRSRWASFALPGGRRLAQEAFRDWLSATEVLWPVGLALVCLLLGHVALTGPWLGLHGKPYDWGQYVVIGVVFPVLLFGVPLFWRWRGWSTSAAFMVKRALVATCLIMFAVLVVASVAKHGLRSELWPVVLAGAQVILMTRPWRRDRIDPQRIVVVFVVAFVAWTVSVSLYLRIYVESPTFLAGFLVAFLLVCGATWDPDHRQQVARIRAWTPANLAGLALIGLMSLRTDHLFEVLGPRGAIHHWGAWVGAADLVREGGWLLWDVPSNYGFLNVLVFALIPTDTPWQSFYLLTAIALFVVSAGLFLALRSMRNGPLNWCFALAIAIAVPMFFNQDLDPSNPVTSTFIFPNWGAYRYLCAFVLVAVLVWEYTIEERTRRQQVVLVIGNGVWLAGVLWSPESAFFCSGAWLPAYVMIVFRMTATDRHRWRSTAAWLALPPAFLAAAIGFIVAFYAARLGRLPDWRSFIDFAQEVGLNVLVVESDPIGPALGMLLGFCLLAIGAVYAGTRAGVPARSFGLWIGLLGASWAANSYGYQRGQAFLHPIAYAALVVMLVLVARRARVQSWDSVVRAGVVPLLVLALTSPFAAVVNNPLAIRDVTSSLVSTARNGFAVEPLLPEADPSLQALMAEAGVRPDDPIVFFGDYLGNLLQPWTESGDTEGERVIVTPHWLPGHPSLVLRWIPPGRGAVYTSRFIERAQLGGWMIQRKTGQGASADFNAFVSGRDQWLFTLLDETHIPTRIYENADWQISWWEYVGDRPEIARPVEGWGLLGPLPPDVVVDGQPLAGTTHPEVWTLFGTGWGLYDPTIGGRPAAPGATLWIYSPEPRTATVRLTMSPNERSDLIVSVNGTQALTRAEQDGQSLETYAGLNAGWNSMMFTGQGLIRGRLEIDTR